MNYVVIKKDSDFLVHHGIKGQKWGIRRFQNEDGTLTEAGKKHRATLIKRLTKADALDNSDLEIGKVLADDKALKLFNQSSESYSDLQKYAKEYSDMHTKMNRYANDKATKELGGTSMYFYNKGDRDKFGAYMILGAKYAQEYVDKNPSYREIKEKYESSSKQYEKDVNNFMRSFLGDEGNNPSVSDLAIAYDTRSNEIRQQTLAERASYYSWLLGDNYNDNNSIKT